MQGGLFYKNTYGVLSRGRGLELQSYGIPFSLIEISQVFEYIYIYIHIHMFSTSCLWVAVLFQLFLPFLCTHIYILIYVVLHMFLKFLWFSVWSCCFVISGIWTVCFQNNILAHVLYNMERWGIGQIFTAISTSLCDAWRELWPGWEQHPPQGLE